MKSPVKPAMSENDQTKIVLQWVRLQFRFLTLSVGMFLELMVITETIFTL